MNKNTLLKQYQKQTEIFRKYFRLSMERSGEEDIHQLRVSVKKLRALLSLIEKITGGSYNKKKHFALFKDFFLISGRVRETQINLDMLRRFGNKYITEHFRQYSEKNLSAFIYKMLRRLRFFDLSAFERLNSEMVKKTAGIKDDEIKKAAYHYLRELLVQINIMKTYIAGDEQLHDIRKKLRTSEEILTIVKNDNNPEMTDKLKNQIKLIREQIGKWHDYDVFILSLKNYAGKEENKSVSSNILKTANQVKSRNSQRKKRIIEMLDDFNLEKILAGDFFPV